jgi:D-alanyl-lipoteichoic acid acyltransferase DltB (MBOAT superfamily)
MWFHSLEFLIFASLALLGHALLNGQALRVWLLVMSYIFYGWGQAWACGLLVISSVLDYIVTLRLDAASSPRARKAWLLLSVVGNVGLLGTFKYLPFLTRTVNRLGAGLGWEFDLAVPDITLPPGISFYTFQTMSYTIDVYRRQMKACRSFTTMALFVAYFPQLVAGPIERATKLMPQLVAKQPRSAEDVMAGVSRILWGLMKKIVFADWLGLFVNQVYAVPSSASGGELLLATYAFAFQIYLDFSAYSDIAIGLGRIMGIRIMENFRWPYLARNLSEFWRRWHISFSTWLRDYLYIPLGGSRRGAARTILNVFLVMFLGGLWHGAANTYILWGLWIGLGLALFHGYATLMSRERSDMGPVRWRDVPGVLLTFHWMLVSWVFFRSQSIGEAFAILSRIAWPFGQAPTVSPEVTARTMVLVAIVVLAHLLRGSGLGLSWERLKSPGAVGAFWGGLIVFMAIAFAPEQEPFIYFQF